MPAVAVTAWTRDELAHRRDEIDQISLEFESLQPGDIIARAAALAEGRAVVTCSFEDAVLAHAATVAVPGIEVAMIDTQYLFAETHWFVGEVRSAVGLNLRIVSPTGVEPDNLWRTDTEACCRVRKVEPLNELLRGAVLWVTGVRRVDGPTRADAPILSFDSGRNLLKLNPLARFTDDDMATYETIHELPRNPLVDRGYPSIGCWPCTRPVAPGEDKRAGRWSGQAKTECGLHT